MEEVSDPNVRMLVGLLPAKQEYPAHEGGKPLHLSRGDVTFVVDMLSSSKLAERLCNEIIDH